MLICIFLYFNIGIKHTIDENILKRLIYFIKQTMLKEKKSSITTLQLFYSLTNFVCFLENQFPQICKEYDEFGYLLLCFYFHNLH